MTIDIFLEGCFQVRVMRGRCQVLVNALTLCVFVVIHCVVFSLGGFAQEPQVEAVVSLNVDDQVDLKVIRLPTLENIVPVVTGSSGGDASPTAATYLAMYEMSLHDASKLLSEDAWSGVQERILSLIGKKENDGPPQRAYREAVQSASEDYPVTFLALPEMLEICDRLGQHAMFSGGKEMSGIEKLMFRLPTRTEWQFAARGVIDNTQREELLYFPRWDSYDKRTEGMIEDLQAAMGMRADVSSVVNQKELVHLVRDAMLRDSAKKQAGLLIGGLLQQSQHFEVNIASGTQTSWLRLESTSPTQWGFERLLGNAREWVLMEPTAEDARRKWTALTNAITKATNQDAEVNNDEFGMLMGGHFIGLGSEKWLEFSIEGGYPLSKARDPEPYSVMQCMGDEDQGVQDGMGGMRVLMERVLSEDWFVAFRQRVNSGDANDKFGAHCDTVTNTINEIGTRDEVASGNAIVETYRILTSVDSNLTRERWQDLLSNAKDLQAAAEDTPAGKNPLLAKFGSGKPKSASQRESSNSTNPLLAKFGGSSNTASSSEDAKQDDASVPLNFFQVADSLATAEEAAR
ncbi:MAG TPA: hypothetical protein DEF45_11410 [Rhodopirellula sp.]|nr:hypothetical protein [Rhodopirellula sp.]